MARRPLTSALVVALVVALATAGWFGYRYYERQSAEATRAEAVTAARQAVTNFMEVNPDSVDTDMQRVSDAATGDFKAEFERDRAKLKKAYADRKIEAHGEVLAAAADVRNSDKDSVRVMLVVDQNVKAGKNDQLRHYRIQVDMAADDSRWLVSTLSFVS